jgi:membrane protein YdbS with pleckstrin-like domain
MPSERAQGGVKSTRKKRDMSQVRGCVLLIAAGVAIYRGWALHGERAWVAFGLGALAVALAVWHFVRPMQQLSSKTDAHRL